MEELIALLHEIMPNVDFQTEQHLVTSGILDSLTTVTLVARLSEAYDIEITPLDLVPENFESASAIYALIQRLDD